MISFRIDLLGQELIGKTTVPRLLCVSVLNGEFLDWKGSCLSEGEFPGSASQDEACKHLDELCSYFVREPLSTSRNPQDENRLHRR